jgi:hypothetical protein
MTFDTCTACGERPVCRLADATIIVTARDHRGVITTLCRACGGGEDDADAKPADPAPTLEAGKATTETSKRGKR